MTQRLRRCSIAALQKLSKTCGSKKEVIRMLRKLLSLGALVVVAVAFGAGPAAAKSGNNGNGPSQSAWGNANGNKFSSDGFSDGRLGV
jgi:hypothetical protein